MRNSVMFCTAQASCVLFSVTKRYIGLCLDEPKGMQLGERNYREGAFLAGK